MPSPGSQRASARVTLRSDARELRTLREHLKEFFAEHEVRAQLTDDLILVANELTTNAIEASALGSDVVVEVHIDPSHITLAIENVGEPFELPVEVALPDKSRSRGRGLALTSRIVDDLCAEQMADGTRVVAKCRRT
jgi:anti-sigma regulatory factor (Ser/Thr protein kinase)